MLLFYLTNAEPETVFLLIGILAGAIFFIDGWGPTEKSDGGKKDFFGSRKFRGLSVIISGSIITPLVDLAVHKDTDKFSFFIKYLNGAFIGWFGAFISFLLLFLIWKYFNIDGDKRREIEGHDGEYTLFKKLRHIFADFVYTLMDFIYLGISENPHLSAKREQEINLTKMYYGFESDSFAAKLTDHFSFSQVKNDAGNIDSLPPKERKKVQDYHKKLINSGKKDYEYSSEDNYNEGLYEFYYGEYPESSTTKYEKCIKFMSNFLDKNADNLDARMYIGISFLYMSFYEEAKKEFDKILLNPVNRYSAYALNNRGYAKSMFTPPDNEGAVADYTLAIELKPLYVEAYFNRGYTQNLLNKNKESVEDYTKVIALRPIAEAYNNRGLVKNQLNDFKGALDDTSKAIELSPELPNSYFTRGAAKNGLLDFKGAIEDFTKAIELKFELTESYFNRGWAKSSIPDYKGAIEDYTKVIELKPDYAEAFNNRGYAKNFIEDFNGGLEDASKAIALKPEFPNSYFTRGTAKNGLLDFKGAIEDFTKAIELKFELTESYFNRGWAKINVHDYKGAIEDYTKVIELKPDYAEAYNNRGNAKNFIEDFNGGLEDASKAIALKPELPNSYFTRGSAKNGLLDYKGALEDYSKAIEINPTYAEAYCNRSDIKLFLKDYAGTLEDATKAIELDPIIPESYLNRGLAYIALKNKEEGCKDLHKAKELGFADADKVIAENCK